MALPLRDSWLARALGGGDDGDFPSRRVKDTHGEVERIASASPADDALVDRLRTGDSAALTEIIAANVPALTRYAARLLHDEAEADDIVQEVLARLWARRASLTVETTVRAYLFGVVRNIVLNLHRHRRVAMAHTVAETEAQPAVHASPADAVLARLTVDQLLAYLPERRRDAVVLRYLGELSYAEIAMVLGTTRVNAERLVARALETLRAIVGSEKKV